ncbi:uncharacterized protein LOC129634210 isoform X1 [Bubalus kerabau]|uniref:uncharacterized protein LOC129634210 isoform X1 n=1 Tax=Bubalus carabanensis TaxID=3119969 RepID=UPI00244E82D6|nr:uncharacterized protein LOC129634210 isoform X1 [Bubalus carabanensis]
MANLQTRGKQKVEKLSGFKDGRRRQTTRKAASATFRERVPRSASYAETHSRMCAANTLPRCPRFPRVLPRTGGSHCAQEGPSAGLLHDAQGSQDGACWRSKWSSQGPWDHGGTSAGGQRGSFSDPCRLEQLVFPKLFCVYRWKHSVTTLKRDTEEPNASGVLVTIYSLDELLFLFGTSLLLLVYFSRSHHALSDFALGEASCLAVRTLQEPSCGEEYKPPANSPHQPASHVRHHLGITASSPSQAFT